MATRFNRNTATKGAMMIFVFGSNLAGRHGRGAALDAKEHYGAEYGVGVGRTGSSYAIPTKDENLNVLALDEIEKHIADFCMVARGSLRDEYLLTPIGTGLAGYSKREIAALFKKHKIPECVYLTSSWIYEEGQ
jgi:hypothetical protein